MNRFVDPGRIEFILTYACTGKCRHCSLGDMPDKTAAIDPAAAETAVGRLAAHYIIDTLMTFGGEPLLHLDTAARIHAAARESGIPHRQLITNGYFTNDSGKITASAKLLAESGVNDVCVSADAFHQETIPIEPVLKFAGELVSHGIKTHAHPAWLVSPEDSNSYNTKTRDILRQFEAAGIPASPGNIIFAAGRALENFSKYIGSTPQQNPYEEDPRNIRTVSIDPYGNTLGGNILKDDILDIIESYRPRQ